MKHFIHETTIVDDLKTETIEGKRHYLTPSGAYPSITTVLSRLSAKGIAEWRRRVGEKEANKISSQASRRGTRVHKMCEDYINNELDIKKFLPHEKEMFLSIQDILDDKVGTVFAQEAALWSDYLKIAGRVDLIAEYDGKISVIDFKTASKPKKKEYISNYFMQASAYCVMYEERTKKPINQIVIIIAVEGDKPQVFIEKRNNYIYDCIDVIKEYYKENK